MPRLVLYILAAFSLISPVVANPITILLTNDDGYLSPGIQALHKELQNAGHTVYLIAPLSNQSGSSTSVTSEGIRFEQLGDQIWRIEGKPADAVRFGIGHLLKETPPDLVISGINFGQNLGQDVMVSGTVGAAITAVQLGVPAIAISAEILFEEAAESFASTLKTFPQAAGFIADLVQKPELLNMPGLLNINFPTATAPKGIKHVRLAPSSLLTVDYVETEPGLWRSGYNLETVDDDNTDRKRLHEGYITISHLASVYQALSSTPQDQKWVEMLFSEKLTNTHNPKPPEDR